MEVDDDGEGKLETSKKIEELERRGIELIKIRPSSLSEWDKAEEIVRLFEKEMKELKEKPSKKIEEKEVRRLGSSGAEDAVMGGVIVAGGASTKAKKKKNKKKRKSKAAGSKKKEIDEGEEVEGCNRFTPVSIVQ